MSKREVEIRKVDFDYFLDNACDMSQPHQGVVLEVTHAHTGKIACYVVHPDDVEELGWLTQYKNLCGENR